VEKEKKPPQRKGGGSRVPFQRKKRTLPLSREREGEKMTVTVQGKKGKGAKRLLRREKGGTDAWIWRNGEKEER